MLVWQTKRREEARTNQTRRKTEEVTRNMGSHERGMEDREEFAGFAAGTLQEYP
jgi:hypothetical protein